jgi:hypothetical protein
MEKYLISQSQIPDKLDDELLELLKQYDPNFLGLYKLNKDIDGDNINDAYVLFDNQPQSGDIDNLKTIIGSRDSLALSINGSLVVSSGNMGDMTTPKFRLYTLDVLFYQLFKAIKKDVKFNDVKMFSVKTVGDVVVSSDVGTVDISTYVTNRTEVALIEFYDDTFPFKSGTLKKKVTRTQQEYENLVAKIFENIII